MSLVKISKFPQATAGSATAKNAKFHTNKFEELYLPKT